MRRAGSIALLLAPLLALAQTTPAPTTPAVAPPPATPPVPAPVLPDPVPVVTATGLPPRPVVCWPGSILGMPVLGATGSQLYWGAVGEIGDWYGWRCPSLDTQGQPVAGVTYAVVKLVRRSYKGQALSTLVNEALQHPRLIDALEAMWYKYDVPCESMAIDMQPACVADMAALSAAAIAGLSPPPTTPAPTGWFVAPWALSKTTPPTRPVFGFLRGRRVAQTYTTAAVGQPCNLSIATVVEGVVTYGAFGPLFSPAEVTVCARK